MKWSKIIRDPLVLLYLVLVVLLAAGMVKVVADYGTRIEARGTVLQQELRQIATERQESIEQEQQEVAEVAQIAHRWQVRAVQLARFIERRGLSVPKPTVPLREPPVVQAETPPPVPVETPEPPIPPSVPPLPELPKLTPEPPPFIPPPPEPLPPVECFDLPLPDPDFCIEIPPTPNPNP